MATLEICNVGGGCINKLGQQQFNKGKSMRRQKRSEPYFTATTTSHCFKYVETRLNSKSRDSEQNGRK